jgi:GxxExxY protein
LNRQDAEDAKKNKKQFNEHKINRRDAKTAKMKILTEPDKRIDELVHAVIGAAIEVHRQLGPGFLEGVYEEALCVELTNKKIFFERQKEISVLYKGRHIGKHRIDLLVEYLLIVELKTVETLADIHKAQVISYLKATGLSLGLLINFNVPVLKNGIQRVIYSERKTVMTPGASQEEDPIEKHY